MKTFSSNFVLRLLVSDFDTTKKCQYCCFLVVFIWLNEQTHYLPDREKEIQESRPLTNINDSFKKVIIVKDHIMPRRNEEGILTIGLFDFLLKEDSLDM